MIKIDNDIKNLKLEVLERVAKLAFDGDLDADHLAQIPFEMIPTTRPRFRCCVYKAREILSQRTRMATGKLPTGVEDHGAVISVIPSACEGCPINRYRVTENCQRCLAKKCQEACPFGAISMKTRSPIIFGFHPSAQKCSAEAARIVRDASIAAGAPEDCIQWIEHPAIEATNTLMNHPGISMVLATGGSGMVKAAYSTGKPALGVGPGNVPCYIHKSCDLKRAATDLMLSKTFDNGMICASEQAVIVDKEIAAAFEAFMKENNCYFVRSDEERDKLAAHVINLQKGAVNAAIVGQSAYEIAKGAGIEVDPATKILLARDVYKRQCQGRPLPHQRPGIGPGDAGRRGSGQLPRPPARALPVRF